MRLFTKNILIFFLSAASCIVMTSFILINISENEKLTKGQKTQTIESSILPLSSTGDFLGLYTTLSTAAPPIPLNIDIISFPSMNGAQTTISAAWNSYSFLQTDAFLPTNGTAYDPLLKEMVSFISGELQYLHYKDTPMSVNMGPMTFPVSAPVVLNGQYLAILVEDGGYATPPMLEADLVFFDPNFGNFSSVQHLQTTTPNPFTYFSHESMSSATNRVDELYFLSGTNLVVVTDFSIFTPHYCWIDMEPSNSSNNYHSFYGVEYKSPGVLLALRETFVNNTPHLDLVEIHFNATTCTVSNIISVYDLQSNIPIAPGGWIINSEYYSTAFDSCNTTYYISSRYDAVTSSRLIEIDIPNSSHVAQILPQYLFGIEWKQKPCPCEASFVRQQFNSCTNFTFVNTSTGSAPMTCYWDFGDPNSGINNTSVQCVDVHQFSSCGTYNVCLTITANGCMETICQPVTVTDNTPPVALCKNNVVLALNANCVANVTPTDIDAGSFDDCSLSLYDVTPNSFSQCGTFPVTLTVTDWCGNTGTCSTSIQVQDNIPPSITCPADFYLTTTSANCMMVVDGLQWSSLSDNCGIPTVTYLVSGASNYSGNGDASGLNFNQGTSFVSYTAFDQCGNSASCSFKVILECICICPSNMIQNPGFINGAILGVLGGGGQTDNWLNGPNHPHVESYTSCCEPISIFMYSLNRNVGSSMYQEGLLIQAGHKYQISFCARKNYTSTGDYSWLTFSGSSAPLVGVDPFNCPACESMGSSSFINNYVWSTYTLPIWTASQNQDAMFIFCQSAFGWSVNWIDNICVKEVFYSCCAEQEAFIENTDNALNTRADQETGEGVFESGNLMECNTIDYINWGDGTILEGPIFSNTALRHAYAEAGTYEVEYQVREFDPQDTSQSVCFDHIFIDSILIEPDTCYCNSFSSMFIRSGDNMEVEVFCSSDPILIECPDQGRSIQFTGLFSCHGNSCEDQVPISWILSGPVGIQTGTTLNDPFFHIELLPSYISQNGVYTLSLAGQCGNQQCPCTIQFIIDCPDLCPCEVPEIVDLEHQVSQGFAQIFSENSCQACFVPIAISDCDMVEWYVGDTNSLPIGMSQGQQSICHTFSSPGSYTILMKVSRFKNNGSLCTSFTKAQEIQLICQPFSSCGNTIIGNANFSDGAINGGLNSGGASLGWEGAEGNPLVVSGTSGSLDSWSIRLQGNRDEHDVLKNVMPFCLDKKQGTISLRIGQQIQSENQKAQTQRHSALVVQVSSGTSSYILGTLPLNVLDSSDWMEVIIPYDLTEWIESIPCPQNPGKIEVQLEISVTNALGSVQGGPFTFSQVEIDKICLDETVAVNQTQVSKPIRISPNPNGGEFVIEFPQPAVHGMSIQIIGLMGQVLIEKNVEVESVLYQIDASDLPQGIYFLQIVSNGLVLSVDKFVKL